VSFSAEWSIGSVWDGGELGFTWDDGIFFIHRAYGVDAQFVGTLDSAVPPKEGDTDRSDTFSVHGDLVFNYFAGVCQDEIVKGDLVGGSDSTAWSLNVGDMR